jgi:hypothetical protein
LLSREYIKICCPLLVRGGMIKSNIKVKYDKYLKLEEVPWNPMGGRSLRYFLQRRIVGSIRVGSTWNISTATSMLLSVAQGVSLKFGSGETKPVWQTV